MLLNKNKKKLGLRMLQKVIFRKIKRVRKSELTNKKTFEKTGLVNIYRKDEY